MIIFEIPLNFLKIKTTLLFIVIAGFLIYGVIGSVYAEWEYSGYGINETYARIVLADPDDAAIIYAATDYFLYISRDEGKSWKEIFTIPGKENTINFIAIANSPQRTIYVASTDGVYSPSDSRYDWTYTYAGINAYCIAAQDSIYIASDKGIFVSDGTYKDIPAKYITLGAARVIYASSDEKIFKSEDNGQTWQDIYSMLRKDLPETTEAEEPVEDNEELFAKINSLVIDPKNPEHIYAASSKGVLFSGNKGKDWSFLTNSGLDNGDIRHMLISKEGGIYVCAYKGVFRYDKEKAIWAEVYEGASFRDARFLSQSLNGTIWVATGNGIFKATQKDMRMAHATIEIPEHIADNFKHEPDIRQVQRAAIRYAEVHPDKINKWRKEARIKALFPEFDLDYDKNVYMGASSFYVGPRDWGVGLKWDVGDLVFSDDQTNIDVRSRLMVQLRDDILDDVTRLYYERRRLQVDMLSSPPKNEKEKLDKLLRIEELTAGIDGLTGGYFSDRLEQSRL